MSRLLLLSTSTVHGHGYLGYCTDAVRGFLGGVERVLFVPYALHDRDRYAELARGRFAELGFGLDPLHQAADPLRALAEAQAVFVGGGNTFRLLKALYDLGLIAAIRERAAAGVPYMGSSAGSNVACPTIKTTNDMPIVYPPSLDALALVPFQINPHYLDPDPGSTHMGETREQRILQFHEDNATPVVGLREGAWLLVEDGKVALRGLAGARVFLRGAEPREVEPGGHLDGLLGAGAAS